jgi:hypothetical protein
MGADWKDPGMVSQSGLVRSRQTRSEVVHYSCHQLARLAAGKATKTAAKAAAPAAVEPLHASVPPTDPSAQLRERVRASLLRRSA